MKEESKEPTFVVTDRRHFTESGERRADVPDEIAPSGGAVKIGVEPPRKNEKAAGKASAKGQTASQPSPAPPPPPAPAAAEELEKEPAGGAMTFLAFLETLYATAMVQLGAAAPGEISRPQADLPGARQTIEILGVLAEKTKGNLTADEAQALEDILYDLRMYYVQVARSITGAPSVAR